MARPKNADPDQRLRFTRDGREIVVAFSELGKLTRVTRKTKKHTLQQAASQISTSKIVLSAPTLSRLENGSHMPTAHIAQRMLLYIYGPVMIQPEDMENTNYEPSSNQALLKNFLEQTSELEPTDREILVSIFSALVKARAIIRTAHISQISKEKS